MKDKIQIKHLNGNVLFECDKHEDDINQLAYAIRQANEQGADLRGADLRGADLRGADLRGAKNAPLVINGLAWIVIIDGLGKMRIGCQEHKIDDWKSFADEEIAGMDSHALEFWNAHKAMLLTLCDSYKHSKSA